jgi:hypothetical protein
MKARGLQPDSREGQAGLFGVAERPVVPGRPGNAGGGKGPWFEVSMQSGESLEIGIESTNSRQGSETAGYAARQSEGIFGLSFL